jgi:hypothetical protein
LIDPPASRNIWKIVFDIVFLENKSTNQTEAKAQQSKPPGSDRLLFQLGVSPAGQVGLLLKVVEVVSKNI